MTAPVSPGFFGKLPSRGDFVVRRLPADFVAGWDEWLQAGLSHSRAQLKERWLDVYLTSPIWRFALSPGFCGADAYCGVVMPNVDRVGRYFPLVAASSCAQGAPLQFPDLFEPWFDDVEQLLLETLSEPPLELDELDERLAALRLPEASYDGRVECGWRWPAAEAAIHWQCTVPRAAPLAGSLSSLLGALLGTELGRYSVWWSEGSEHVEPSVLITDDFPAPEAFAAMLDGNWGPPWLTASIRGNEAATSSAAPTLAWTSAAVTDVGNSRSVNEDSYACRDDIGTWIVADGLGGHRSGDVASRMVTAVAGEIDEGGSLDARMAALERGVRMVNACLHVLAETASDRELIGSTVAALMIDGGELACSWAGDSRIYRWRAGRLEQLTDDHAEQGPGEARTNVVTKAVGGPGVLELGVVRDIVEPGDRYLLCTDGLYGQLEATDLAAALALDSIEAGCASLRTAVLAGEAPDNLTAIIVDVSTPT